MALGIDVTALQLLKLAVLSFLGVATLPGCATSYSARPIEATVVDAQTRRPLSGVNVVAHWVLSFGWEGGQGRDLELMETLTDDQGRFSFPGWGPKPVPADLPWEARMKSQDPELVFFKPGYLPRAVSNKIRGPNPDAGPAVRSSDWTGKTIELEKFTGSPSDYGFLAGGTLTGVSWGGCGWQKIPKMMLTLIREGERLSDQRVQHSLPTWRELEQTAEVRRCGPVRDYLESHSK